jgi:hypothetical protein
MPTEVQKRNPYVGPRPFERQDRDLFFGRDREASDLLSLIIAHRALLLYAQSGAGKTSLLNARLIPLLEEEGFEVLPLARVRGLLEDIEPEEIPNLYVFNALMSWAAEEADPKRLTQISLADFLKEREHPTDEMGLPSPRVVILDQFEELFTSHQERWPDREGFFEQVRDALEADDLLRVVFVIREDHTARLDPFAPVLPEKLRTRLRMERLGKEAALAAVKGPLRDTRRSFADGIAEQLVEELLKVRIQTATGETAQVPGEYVEPVQLQVVCQSLWQDLPPDVTVITGDHLQDFGDIDEALSGFYERSIKKAAQESDTKERDLRRWFERSLITPAGTRGTVYRGPEETGGIPNAAVDVLENLHLIRGEWRAGAPWYELTHDRFIEPIQKSNEAWRDVRQLGIPERREQIIDYARRREQGEEWEAAGRAYERLLELDQDNEEEKKRWTLALKRVEEESELASLYTDAQGAIEKNRWTQASKVLAEIREMRLDYRNVGELEEEVKELRQKRKRRAQMNAIIFMATTALLGFLSGVWLAERLAMRVSQDLALYTIGALAALSGLLVGAISSSEFGGDILDIPGLGKMHIVRRFLSILFSWFASELMILFIGLLGWGAGAFTLWVFNKFTGFYVIVWGWGIVAALAVFGYAIDDFRSEPADPSG